MAELITMPKLGFDMAEGVLQEWLKKIGDPVAEGEIIAIIETDKASVEVPAYHSGVLLETLAAPGDVVPVGKPIGVVGEAGEAIDRDALGLSGAQQSTERRASPEAGEPTSESAQTPDRPVGATGGDRAPVSPVAARMASELDIELSEVRGSGPGGRIVKRDIEARLQEREKVPAQRAAPPITTPSHLPASDEHEPELLSPMRQTIGRRMTESKQQAPHFYVTMDVDMAAAMALRAQVNGLLPEDEKVSVNDLVLKACAIALVQFPRINASFAGEAIHLHREVNIGLAVARETGLLTAVVRQCDRKGLTQIAQEARELVQRARDGRVRPDDMLGGTFTISNLGMYGVDEFIAIINPPQAAIMAVGAVQRMPVVDKDGSLVAGMRMKMTLSADHRVTDGAEVARFLVAVREALEAPLRLLL